MSWCPVCGNEIQQPSALYVRLTCSRACAARLGNSGKEFPTTADLFWPKVKKTKGCWNWTASTFKAGYGKINRRGKLFYAHRLSWELSNGKIPPGLSVLHKCDNRKCVNPKHLFLGTHKDNMLDMVRKLRQPTRIIEPSTVRRIRAQISKGLTSRTISESLGVTQHIVNDIKRGKTWKWVA